MNKSTSSNSQRRSALWRILLVHGASLIGLAFASGCASTSVTGRETIVTEKLPRPNHIWVYDFAATPADVPSGSAVAGQLATDAPAQTPEQIATGRQLGAAIAAQLAQRIRDMGLPAAVATAGTSPQINDIVFRGYLISVEEGSAAKRVTVGFGSGTSELQTGVEGFQMTAQGLRKLGSGVLQAEGSKGPGAALGGASWIVTGSPAGLIIGGGMKAYGEVSGSSKIEGRAKQTAEEIAKELKKRFEQEGWIQ